MTRKCVTDDEYGRLKRRLEEVSRRIDEGTIPFERTMAALQVVLEGKLGQHFANIDPEYYFIEVNYNLSLDEMLSKAGPFAMIRNDFINKENFPIYGDSIKNVCLELIYFRENLNLRKILAIFALLNYRPAKIEELLSFAAKYPLAQAKHDIVALDKIGINGRASFIVPKLSKTENQRTLEILSFPSKMEEAIWVHQCGIYIRFAAVKIRD